MGRLVQYVCSPCVRMDLKVAQLSFLGLAMVEAGRCTSPASTSAASYMVARTLDQ